MFRIRRGRANLSNRSYAFLELTPPAYKHKTSLVSEELFRVLQGVIMPVGWTSHFKTGSGLSLEIVSTRSRGIRYLLRVEKTEVELVRQAISAYLPEIYVRQAKDFLTALKPKSEVKVSTYRLNKHFSYPLNDHTSLSAADPVAYLISGMTSLGKNELLSVQVVVAPYAGPTPARIFKPLNQPNFMAVLKVLINTFESTLTVVGDTLSGSYFRRKPLDGSFNTEVPRSSRKESNLAVNKLGQPLFLVNIRTLVSGPNSETITKRSRAINAAISVYNSNRLQSIVPEKMLIRSQLNMFRLRSLSGFNLRHKLFSPSEIAAIYHFPVTYARPAESLVVAHSRTLPPSQTMTSSDKLDVLIGKNVHQGKAVPIGLTSEERTKHVYIVGGTGNGKSTLLEYAISQDLRSGKGLALIDPHGDLAENVLRQIPNNRLSDVIYFNPDDTTKPVSLNLFELKPGLSESELVREKELITESAVVVLRKLFADEQTNGHRIEYILRNAIQTALTLKDPTLYTIYDLLTDYRFRSQAVAKLSDQQLKNFWQNEVGQAGSFQRVKMLAGITAKIGRFTFSNVASSILARPVSSFSFEEVIDSGKILICNLSKGLIGEDSSAFFGSIIMAKLQIAAMKRARLNQKDRRDFFLYVDEFQNFASNSFAQLLSEARKYRLYLTMAEQSTSQQDYERVTDIILANTGTIISFRSGSPADERLLLPLFRPYLDNGDLASLGAYNFYARIAGMDSTEPVSGQTILMANKGSLVTSKEVKRLSRDRYGGPPLARMQLLAKPTTGPRNSVAPKIYPVPRLI